MAILTDVDRRSVKVKLGLLLVYFLLTLGATTMIYPFTIMIATATTDKVDYEHYRPIPRYLHDWDALYLKYTHAKQVNDWNGARRPYLIWQGLSGKNYNQEWSEITRFPHLDPGDPTYFDPEDPRAAQRVADWHAFKSGLPEHMTHVYNWTDHNNGPLAENYQKWLERKYGEIEELNAAYGSAYSTFTKLDYRVIKVGAPVHRFIMPYKGSLRPDVDHDGPHYTDWMEWRREALVPGDIGVCLADPWYQYNILGLASTLERYNELCGTEYAELAGLRMPETAPANPKEREFWEEIVRHRTAWVFISIADAGDHVQGFLKEKYGDAAEYNVQHGTDYANLGEIRFPERYPEGMAQWRTDWGEVLKSVPVQHLSVTRPETLYTRFLQERYATADALNGAHGTSWAAVSDAQPPVREEATLEVYSHKTYWRLYYAFYNFWMALRFMVSQGPALLNTVILVLMHVLIQITVNPLAAYALSRYRPRYGNKLLLFFIATMAFPPTVGMIPQFLMLKHFGLLNTYWAIVLPMSAQGYFIFLLKGFFDSLPREMFEAAKIDGASEIRMFYQIAVPVCKPIFAVIALEAFRLMYGAFMFAMLVCQDSSKWTIMVFIYQFRQMEAIQEYHVMAVLTITALPTLLVFLFAQKTIIKGIVIPQMK